MRINLIAPRRMAGTAATAVLAILALASAFGCGVTEVMTTDAGSTGGTATTGSGGHSTTSSGGVPGTGGGSGGTQGGGTTGAGTGGSPGSGGSPAGTGGMAETGGAPGSGGKSTGTGGAAPGSGGASGGSSEGGTAGRIATGGGAGRAVGGAAGGSKGSEGGQGGASSGAGGGGGMGPAHTSCTKSGAATSATPTIYIIGDSTASLYDSDVYPRMGWAQPLQEYFTPACAKIQDKALSGRSSKSFYNEQAWTPIKNALRPGDFVLIQFGHNDEKDANQYPELHTDPQTTYKQYLSIYIDDTTAKGGTPILITSVTRNSWSGATLTDSHMGYPPAMRELAAAKHVSLVDGTKLTMSYIMRIGQATATKNVYLNLSPGDSPNYPTGVSDSTHLQDKGAHVFAEILLADMYRQVLPVASLLKAEPHAP